MATNSCRRVWTPQIFDYRLFRFVSELMPTFSWRAATLKSGVRHAQKNTTPMRPSGQQTRTADRGRRIPLLEVDQRSLRHLVLKQHPEWTLMSLAIPGLELRERVENIGKRRKVLGRCQTSKDLLGDRNKALKRLRSRIAIACA